MFTAVAEKRNVMCGMNTEMCMGMCMSMLFRAMMYRELPEKAFSSIGRRCAGV